MAEGNRMSLWDYAIFVLLFVSSTAIGMYHACRRGRGELFSSERNLGAVSVGLSLTSTFMSAAQVLGVPSETYLFGAKFLQMCLGQSINVVITVIIFLPVFYRLRIKTTNKYLEMRFNKTVKMYGFILYIFATVFYTGIIIYAPAVILNQATKLNIWMLVLTTGIVCTLYTTMGGMRAVVWTDVLQTLLMVSGFWVFTVRGIFRVGGIQKVWQAVYNGGRINFGDFNPDPTQRYTFWTLLLGGSLVWLAMYGVNQAQVQRYISCSSERSARWALFINLAGLWTVVGSAVCCGLVMFAFYKDCDPIKARILSATDQLVPHFVLDIFEGVPGIIGLFLICAYSGTLSTVSTGINSLALVTLEDIVKPCCGQMSEKQLKHISRALSFLFGFLCIIVAMLCSLLDNEVLRASFTVMGVTGGPLLGIFILGMFFPVANSLGVLTGSAVGFCLSLWISLGASFYPPSPAVMGALQTEISGCSFLPDFNHSVTFVQQNEYSNHSDINRTRISETLYGISYLYYGPVGTITTIIVGLIVSYVKGSKEQDNVSADLLWISLRQRKVTQPIALSPAVTDEVDEHLFHSHSFYQESKQEDSAY